MKALRSAPLGHLERALLEAIKHVADLSDPDLRLSLVLGAQAVGVAYTAQSKAAWWPLPIFRTKHRIVEWLRWQTGDWHPYFTNTKPVSV
jgi:hypothetical protein